MGIKKFAKRQNKSDALLLQAAARYCFNKAETINVIYLIILFILPIFKIVFPKSSSMTIILIAWFFISLFINYKLNNLINMGADFKSEFDDFVFEKTNTISRRMLSKAKDIKVSHRLFMDAMVENTGNSKVGGVRDWYTSFTKDEQGARNPILSAQEENIFFDRNTRFKYLNWPILFTVLVASSITIWCHMEVSDVFPMLFVTFASLSAKLIDIFRSLHKAQKLNEEAKNMIDKGEDILEIQKNLDRIRRINTLSLSLHYNLKRIKLHQQYKDY